MQAKNQQQKRRHRSLSLQKKAVGPDFSAVHEVQMCLLGERALLSLLWAK
jgi:hypothetical protein